MAKMSDTRKGINIARIVRGEVRVVYQLKDCESGSSPGFASRPAVGNKCTLVKVRESLWLWINVSQRGAPKASIFDNLSLKNLLFHKVDL